MADKPRKKRINEGGNFCFHDPVHPALEMAIDMPKNSYEVIKDACERLKQFYKSPSMFQSLNLANGSSRKMRSERREAVVRVSQTLIKFTELATLRVGQPTSQGFANYSYNVLVTHSGLSYSRVRRAMKDLQKAGFVSVKRLYEIDPDDRSYKGKPAVKCINVQLFEALGLGDALQTARDYASDQLKQIGKQVKGYTRTGKAKQRLLNAMTTPKLPPLKRTYQTDLPTTPDRITQETALGYKQKHPDWSVEQCYEAAEKLLKRKA